MSILPQYPAITRPHLASTDAQLQKLVMTAGKKTEERQWHFFSWRRGDRKGPKMNPPSVLGAGVRNSARPEGVGLLAAGLAER